MLVPLHSSLTAEAQLACFVRPPSGLTKVFKPPGLWSFAARCWRGFSLLRQTQLISLPCATQVVLATNIAETSITVDDVTAVIDTCRHKENRYDHRRRLEALVEDFAPRGCMTQRRGRAGRVAAGMAFHLITSHRYTLLPAQQTAELLRVPLERAALRAKRLFPDIPAAHTLSELPQPPSAQAIRSALATLISLGAIEPAVERGVGRAAAQEALTPLGCHLAVLPLDVRIGAPFLELPQRVRLRRRCPCAAAVAVFSGLIAVRIEAVRRLVMDPHLVPLPLIRFCRQTCSSGRNAWRQRCSHNACCHTHASLALLRGVRFTRRPSRNRYGEAAARHWRLRSLDTAECIRQLEGLQVVEGAH